MSSVDGNSELFALADALIETAKSNEQIEVYISRGSSTEVRVHNGEVEHFVSATSSGIGVRVIHDGRTGFAHAGTLDADVAAELLAEARENVSFSSVDEWAALAEPDGVDVTEQELWSDELERYPTADKIELAKQLEQMTLGRDSRIRVDDTNFVDGGGEGLVVTTTGIRRYGRSNSCYLSVSTLADDTDGTRTGFGFAVGAHPGEFDVERAAREGVDRATRLLGATKPASRSTTVVLDPFVTAQLLGVVGSTLSGDAVVRGRSLFSDRVGESIAAPTFTLVDDPTDRRAYTATDLDGEGLAARRNVLIDRGELKGFVHSSYSARRAKEATTGNAIRGGYAGSPSAGCLALQLVPGDRPQADLISSIDDGVLIEGVSGLHSGVNTVSGDFSVGATGMTIRDGALAEPVREFTIASTIQRMLNDIIEVGVDLEWLPMRASGPSIVIRDVMVSGSS